MKKHNNVNNLILPEVNSKLPSVSCLLPDMLLGLT
jgi:hypothetical protein